jgi:bifunctional non-homologous end joining protein LigD
MLATLTREQFSDPEWIFEPKLDGIRCLAYRKNESVKLYSRNKLLLNETFSELLAPLSAERPQNFIIDGEVVALEGKVSRFEALQRRGHQRTRLFYYIFDVLFFDGSDLTRLPLLERKNILRSALSFRDPLRFTEHRHTEGEKFYRQACSDGWEGIIAKRADSLYVSGRSDDWLKFKCENQQEFVVVGYTDPQGQREGIGALLVGVYDKGRLKFAGKVGTGFDNQALRLLESKLSPITCAKAACEGLGMPKKNVHWVKPKFVAQVAFTEWTSGGKLRHPRYLGLRTDKQPKEVTRE